MTTKINIEINEDNSSPVRKDTYGTEISEFSLKINNTNMPSCYVCPITIYNKEVAKEQIIADIVCSSIGQSLCYSSCNGFEATKDRKKFETEFGYETEDLYSIIKELSVFNEALQYLPLTKEETDFINSYIERESSLEQATTLVNKYFNVSFISKHYDNNRG